MSRIGKLPITVPSGVEVTMKDNVVSVKGPKGTLSQAVRPEVTVTIEPGVVTVTRHDDEKPSRAFHGLYRQLIHNMIQGVSQGYQKTLLINGVGYKAEMSKDNKELILSLGYSNPIEFMVPEDVEIKCDGASKVIVSGIDKQRVGEISAEIRSLRKPEPYKGKGIKYESEVIRRKVGKSGGKK